MVRRTESWQMLRPMMLMLLASYSFYCLLKIVINNNKSETAEQDQQQWPGSGRKVCLAALWPGLIN